jgi:hypothetical protein
MDDDQPENRIIEALKATNPEYPVACILMRAEPDVRGAFRVNSWVHGLSKRQAAHVVAQLAREWQAEADAEAERVRLN